MVKASARHAAAKPSAPRAVDVPDAPLTRRAALVVAAALLVAWAVAFAPLFAGRTFVVGDAAAYRPWAEFSRATWAATHHRVLWNPYVFFGMPGTASLADPRPQWLPGPLLSLADAAAPVTDRWRVPLALLAGALAMAALARSLWRCGAEACALAGGAWLLAPALLVPLAFGHDAEVWTLALWPVVALAARATLGAREPGAATRAALALALALALQALLIHPQFLAYGLLAAAVLALPLARAATAFARLVTLAAALLGAAMSAAVWLPAMLYGASSVRALTRLMVPEALSFSAGPRDLLSAVWPHAAGFGGASYWGAMRATDYPHALGAPLVAFALAGAFAVRSRARGTALALAALVAFALVAACGPRTPLGTLLLALPVTSAFRTPITWLALAQFAAALLAARGLHAAREPRGRAALVGGGLLALAGVALLATAAGASGYAAQMSEARAALADIAARAAAEAPVAMRDLGLRLLLAGLALALVFGRGRFPAALARGAFAAAVLLGVLDLASVSVPLAWRASGPVAALAPPAAGDAERAFAADPFHRALSLRKDLYFSNAWIAWRARTVSGLHGASPSVWREAFEARLFDAPGFLRAAAVRWLVLPPGAPATGINANGWVSSSLPGVLENQTVPQRVYAVPRVVALARDADVLASLADPAFAPESLALTTDAAAAGDYAPAADVHIGWRDDDPDLVMLAVDTRSRAFVVLADTWFAGWSATLDGQPLPIARVNQGFRGVVVPAGAHAVRFAYVPPGWTVGVTLALAGWIVFVVALAGALAERKRP